MTVRTVVQALAGATISISANLPATYDAAGYGGTTMIYTAVGEVENYGSHGVTANVSTHVPVDTAVTAKVKGSKDYGTLSLTIGSLPGDAGQILLNTASESNAHYSIKLSYPDTTVHYMDVLVTKLQFVDGAVNDVQKISVDLAVCRKPVIVAAV